jgi:DNA-binding IclR family transcriptional regulator
VAAQRAGDGTQQRSESVAGVERALDVLMLFVRSKADTLGVTEEMGASKAAVHRILSTFRNRDFPELDGALHRYRLGPEIPVLGLSHLDRMDLRTIARPWMADLAKATNETLTLSMRIGWTRVYVEQVLPECDIKMAVQFGRPFPLHAGASSKALLAFTPEDEATQYLREHHLEALAARTITDPGRLECEFAAIREKGHAVSFGERDAGAGSAGVAENPLHVGERHQRISRQAVSGAVTQIMERPVRAERRVCAVEHRAPRRRSAGEMVGAASTTAARHVARSRGRASQPGRAVTRREHRESWAGAGAPSCLCAPR